MMHTTDAFVVLLLMTSIIYESNSAVTTRLDQLYTDVFTNYSNKGLPLLNHTQQVGVEVTASVVNINEFDEISGELSLTMAFTFEWRDRRLSWRVADYDSILSLPVTSSDLWTPQIYLLQSSETLINIADNPVRARLYHDGSIAWYTGKVIKVACSVDVKYFPYDEQTCDVTLLDWSLYESEMKLRPSRSDVQMPHLNHNSQWELRPSALNHCDKPEFEQLPCLSLKLVLKRRSHFFVIYIVVPLILLGLTNNIVFIMPPSSGERTSVSVTILLSFLVYMDTVHNIIPQSSQPMAYIYLYMLYLLMYSAFSLLFCVISLRFYDKQSEVPRFIELLIWYARFRWVHLHVPRKGDERVENGDSKTKDEILVTRPGEKEVIGLGDFIKQSSLEPGIINLNGTKSSKASTEEAVTKCDKFAVTWEIVGKTFDFYCCLILTFIFIVLSIYTFYNLSENKGLRD